MAEMEAKFEEHFAMLSMTAQRPQTYAPPPPQYPSNPQPMQTEYFTTPPPPFIPPPATIHVPSPQVPAPQQPPPYPQYNAGKKRRKGQGTRSQGWWYKRWGWCFEIFCLHGLWLCRILWWWRSVCLRLLCGHREHRKAFFKVCFHLCNICFCARCALSVLGDCLRE